MSDWTKAHTGPLALLGFAPLRVFLAFASLAKLRQGQGRWWLSAAAAIMMVAVVAPGLGFAQPELDPSLFKIKNYGGQCLDYGQPFHHSPPTVYLNDCAGAKPIRVEEIMTNNRHEVILHAGTKVLGITRRPENAFASGLAPTEFALELQDPAGSTEHAQGADQVFALDGDSIILASSRPCINIEEGDKEVGMRVADWVPLPGDPTPLCPPPPPQLVIQIQNARGAYGSPLVVGPRNLEDSEFWDFEAVFPYGKLHRPTSGFVRVSSAAELWNAICEIPFDTDPNLLPDDKPLRCQNKPKSKWGLVIKVEPASPDGIDIGPSEKYGIRNPALYLPAGITIRGDRRGINLGPQISALQRKGMDNPGAGHCDACMFQIHGDYVRITGMRLLGDNIGGSTDDLKENTIAINVDAADTQADVVAVPGRTYVADSFPSDQNGCPDGFVDDPELNSCFACRDGGSYDLVQKLCIVPPKHMWKPSSGASTEYIAIIDHNDISYWQEAAVMVNTLWNPVDYYNENIPCDTDDPATLIKAHDPATLANVRIERNFLHNNQRWSGGYGANVSRAVILGNVFLMNRHGIAAGGEPHNEYRAWYNLVLSSAPTWWDNFEWPWHCWYIWCPHHAQQDFDVHGTGKGSHQGYGWQGSFRVDIAANTFLGTDWHRPNFELRGHPCTAAYFRDNVSLQEADEDDGFPAINLHDIGKPDLEMVDFGSSAPARARSPVSGMPSIPNSDVNANMLWTQNNQFGKGTKFGNAWVPYSNPTDKLKVGDFDGDGLEDLFLATGTAWYYSPGGTAEWRFLSAKEETADKLLFGDFDCDGRTDVFTQVFDRQSGRFNWMVSWAGVSPWEKINDSQWSITDFYVGDFVGDCRADVFFARGDQWFVSDGGRGAFIPYGTSNALSSLKVQDLAFGHFDNDNQFGDDKKIDVVGVANNQWMVVFAQDPEHKARTLRNPALTATMKDLIVADFGRTGSSDIVSVSDEIGPSEQWKISRLGRGAWEDLTYIEYYPGFVFSRRAAVGRFDEAKRNDRKGADILVWETKSLGILLSGTGAEKRYSRQEMR